MPFLARRLLAWYRKNARDLPWRRTRDPYRIWVSEVMLQQTTVNTVIPYYLRWIKIFPTIHDLAAARPQRVLRAWQGLGYYRRARHLHESARLICRDFNGKIPTDAHRLRQLPGFGPYTTAAVLSIAFNQRRPLIDTNVRRVLLRLYHRHASSLKPDETWMEDVLTQHMPARDVRHFNQALMELGALICRSSQPLCGQCPLNSLCRARQHGDPDSIPKRSPKVFEQIRVAAGLIEDRGKYFIQRRPPTGLLADLWEFPGGKVKDKETVRQALERKLNEELGVRVTAAQPWTRIRHAYTKFKVDLHIWRCSTDPLPRRSRTARWVDLSQLDRYPMPSANARIIKRLSQKKKGSKHAHSVDQ